MQLKCRIVKVINSACLVKTNHVVLLSVHQDPLWGRSRPQPTPGRFVLIQKQNNIDQNQFWGSFNIQYPSFKLAGGFWVLEASIFIIQVCPGLKLIGFEPSFQNRP